MTRDGRAGARTSARGVVGAAAGACAHSTLCVFRARACAPLSPFYEYAILGGSLMSYARGGSEIGEGEEGTLPQIISEISGPDRSICLSLKPTAIIIMAIFAQLLYAAHNTHTHHI